MYVRGPRCVAAGGPRLMKQGQMQNEAAMQEERVVDERAALVSALAQPLE